MSAEKFLSPDGPGAVSGGSGLSATKSTLLDEWFGSASPDGPSSAPSTILSGSKEGDLFGRITSGQETSSRACPICSGPVTGSQRFCNRVCYEKHQAQKRDAATVPCVVCGTAFYRSPAHTARAEIGATCSRACWRLNNSGENNPRFAGGSVPVTCLRCGKVTLRNQSEAKRVTACSKSCARKMNWEAAPNRLTPRPCPVCGASFAPWNKGSKHCSRKCAAAAHAKRMAGSGNGRYVDGRSALPIEWETAPPKDQERRCDRCGAAYRPKSRTSQFCGQSCRYAAHGEKVSGQKSGRWVHGQGNSGYPRGWTGAYRAFIRRRDGNKCRLCNMTEAQHGKALPVHHIDYQKENLDILNLITVCRFCHGQMHGRPAAREKWKASLSALLSS